MTIARVLREKWVLDRALLRCASAPTWKDYIRVLDKALEEGLARLDR